ncbi:Ferritin [Aphelenchoides fujianensis]|nr:Ferritin [Aphelenchoides fujianensis]
MPGQESQIRQNFHADSEAALNKQINIELYASYVYLSMSFYFDREDVAMPNLSAWCKKQSDEEREHAMKFMKYQNTRGGRLTLQPIEKPEKDEWGSPLEAFQSALALEKYNNKSLLELHDVAARSNDAQFCDFLEGEYLKEQVESIEEIGKYITQLKTAGKGLGEYLFDKEFGS